MLTVYLYLVLEQLPFEKQLALRLLCCDVDEEVKCHSLRPYNMPGYRLPLCLRWQAAVSYQPQKRSFQRRCELLVVKICGLVDEWSRDPRQAYQGIDVMLPSIKQRQKLVQYLSQLKLFTGVQVSSNTLNVKLRLLHGKKGNCYVCTLPEKWAK